jgi:hypothetical protein
MHLFELVQGVNLVVTNSVLDLHINYFLLIYYIFRIQIRILISVSDPHPFYADPHPFYADPHPT